MISPALTRNPPNSFIISFSWRIMILMIWLVLKYNGYIYNSDYFITYAPVFLALLYLELIFTSIMLLIFAIIFIGTCCSYLCSRYKLKIHINISS